LANPRADRSSLRHLGATLVVALLASAPTPAPGADAAAGKALAKKCQTCHGIDGVARIPEAPTIAGESTIYLIKQLKAFRAGERKSPQMSIIAEPLSDDDIANLAAWYASIKVSVELPADQ